MTEKETAEAIGRNIVAAREKANVRQVELSLVSGVNRMTLGNVERGRNMPSCRVLWLIAEALRIPMSTFFVGL